MSEPSAESRYEITRVGLPLELPHTGHCGLEFPTQGLPPGRRDGGGEMSLLRRRVPADRPLGRWP